MKRILFFLALLPTFCYSETLIYFYRVSVTAKTRETTKDSVKTIDRKDSSQPYVNTKTLDPSDTNYYLISVVPKDNINPELQLQNGVDLYKVMYIDSDGGWQDLIDNSKVYSVDEDWKVKKSS